MYVEASQWAESYRRSHPPHAFGRVLLKHSIDDKKKGSKTPLVLCVQLKRRAIVLCPLGWDSKIPRSAKV